MSRNLKPRPTEYKGVRYRSKSEAMFARWLELECECEQYDGFAYEPTRMGQFGWVPDFVAWKLVLPASHLKSPYCDNIPEIDYAVIEYKPSIPTETYLDEWVVRCRSLREFLVAEGPFSSRLRFFLYYGSVFSSEVGCVYVEDDYSDWYYNDVDSCDWLEMHRGSILATRFDLRHERVV